MIMRGALYWGRLDKRRPVLVISADARNRLANDIIAIPCSTRLRPALTHVEIRRGEGGAPETCMAYCEQIVTMSRIDLDDQPLGIRLSKERIAEVERAIMRAIGIPILP